jgi:uncharacterized protein (UPF0303 family)
MSTDIQRDLEIMARQEQALQFDAFDRRTAWELGTRLKTLAEADGMGVLIEVRMGAETVFLYAMPGTAPDNTNWARRKHNTVDLVHRSSYSVGQELQVKGYTLTERLGVSDRDYTAAGGCFPIRVRGVGFVGTVTVSGLPQRDDHRLVVQALAQMLNVSLDEQGLQLP